MPVAYEWLMPLAPWEPAERLLKALESLCHQTWPARRLIVSVDGLLSDQLAQVLHHAALPVFVLESPCWQGTGPTLAAGLLECQCDWVLRADADDRSSPYRAERQLRHLLDHPHLAVLGCQLSEISNMNRLVALRRVPLRPQAVTRMLSWRNPINHPTVALNRQKVLLAGSYRATLGFEDWDLWLRLNRQGLVLANLPDILVTAEVGKEHLKRRHGLSYVKREFDFLFRCHKEHLIPAWKLVLLMLARLPLRLLPTFVLANVMSVLRPRMRFESDW